MVTKNVARSDLILLLIMFFIFVIFAILFVYYCRWLKHSAQCVFNPNPWCWNDWHCPDVATYPVGGIDTTCPNADSPTGGLAKCVWGGGSKLSVNCDNTVVSGSNAPFCGCNYDVAANCFYNCPLDTDDISGTVTANGKCPVK